MRAAVTLEATDAVNSFKFRVDGWSFICVKKKEEVFATASVVSFEYWAVRKPVCRRVGFFGYGPGAVRNKTNGPANKVENFYFYYFFSKRKFMQITGYAYNERPANKNSLETNQLNLNELKQMEEIGWLS